MFTASIPKSKQSSVMESFWLMMKSLESNAYNELNVIDIHMVTSLFKQWNDIMKDDAKPMWQIFAAKEGKTTQDFLQEKFDAKRGRK